MAEPRASPTAKAATEEPPSGSARGSSLPEEPGLKGLLNRARDFLPHAGPGKGDEGARSEGWTFVRNLIAERTGADIQWSAWADHPQETYVHGLEGPETGLNTGRQHQMRAPTHAWKLIAMGYLSQCSISLLHHSAQPEAK